MPLHIYSYFAGPTAESSIELQELASLSQNESTENDEVSPSPPNASSNDEQTTIEHDTRRTENEALPSDGPSAREWSIRYVCISSVKLIAE